MANFFRMQDKWKGTLDAVSRFSFMVILLAAAVVTNAFAINGFRQDTFTKLTVSLILGASVYAVLRLIYERSGIKPAWQFIFMGISAVTSVIYYLIVRNYTWNVEVTLRTTVIFFILLVSFLWVPAIKSRLDFNQTFLAAFKGFFLAGLFNGVLYLGVMLIFAATNALLFSVDGKAYTHAANIIFILLAPIHFLSLLPHYPGRQELEEAVLPNTQGETAQEPSQNIKGEEERKELHPEAEGEAAGAVVITPSRFLEALISYVVIPITAVFTIILLLYIITNITGKFWTDNLMEPLLVSYSIVVIVVYLLASTINNAYTKYFRLVFPKVLVPVVLFQTISSLLKIGEDGITYGRYYVILFGIFATAAGILFCIKPVRCNGLIAPILICLSVISILPVINAFNVSKADQVNRLAKTLERNGMIQEKTVKKNPDISEKDRQIIISSVHYLNRMDYTKDIKWLQGYNQTFDFEATFGFTEYGQTQVEGLDITIIRDTGNPLPIAGYDFMQHMSIYSNNENNMQLSKYELNGKTYGLFVKVYSKDDQVIILEKNGREINRLTMKEVFDKFEGSTSKTSAAAGEVTFTQDNETSTLSIIADSIYIREWEGGRDEQAEVNVLVKIK